MSKRLAEFVRTFVAPLLSGGDLEVAAPVRPSDFQEMLAAVHTLRRGELGLLRLRRAQQVVADPGLPEPDGEELALWAALYNTLVLDHPERDRVWARQVTWQRVELASRYWLQLAHPSGFDAALVRHIAVGAFIEAVRRDQLLSGPDGEQRFVGQQVPRRRLRWAVPGVFSVREENIPWWTAAHTPEVERLLQDVLWASPMTCLLRPRHAPPGWNPLTAAAFLHERAFARVVCHTWAGSRLWIETGGAVLGALLFTLTGRPTQDPEPAPARAATTASHPVATPLALAAAPIDAGPADVAALVGALIHVHFLRVLEFGARLGVAPSSRDRPVQMFLALPLILPALVDILGAPLPSDPRGGFDAQVQRRWIEYCDHLAELIPRATVENLLATLVPRVVKAASA
ncbi:MAG: hypothetical protein JNL82_38420 [Myxococcales bacterium]|nr:hypothetical protein [Myxococcales bacterium]